MIKYHSGLSLKKATSNSVKLYFHPGRFHSWQTRSGIICLSLALIVGEGCGKHSATPPATPSLPSNSTYSGTESAVTPPSNRMQPSVQATSTDNAGPTQLQLLNRALLGWKIKNHRQPGTFEEFANSAGFQVPAPPSGKKYSLKSGFIVLVNVNQ